MASGQYSRSRTLDGCGDRRRRKACGYGLGIIFTSIVFATHAANPATGTITGIVRLAGNPPAIATREVTTDVAVCGSQPRPMQSLLLTTNHAIQNVIIYLGGPATNGATAPVILDQRGCEFVPRIQIARSGATLLLRNSDPVLHIVQIDALNRTNGPQTLLQAATPYAGYEKKFQLANFREPALLKATGRNGHDWMAAFIAILPHPWAVLTDEAGRFTLKAVPAGTHKLYAWHEVLGTQTRDVKVVHSQTATVTFEFKTGP